MSEDQMMKNDLEHRLVGDTAHHTLYVAQPSGDHYALPIDRANPLDVVSLHPHDQAYLLRQDLVGRTIATPEKKIALLSAEDIPHYVLKSYGEGPFLSIPHLKDVPDYQSLLIGENQRLREAWQAEHRLALYDALTGTANRNAYLRDRPLHVKRAAENLSCYGVLFLDLKHLKSLNDIYGHHTGDLAIEQVGEALRHSLKRETRDDLYRTGGDEFVVVCHDIDQPGLEGLVGRIQRHIADITLENPFYANAPETFTPEDRHLKVSLDIGYALSAPLLPEQLRAVEDSALVALFEEVVRQADQMAYHNKERSSNPSKGTHQRTRRFKRSSIPRAV